MKQSVVSLLNTLGENDFVNVAHVSWINDQWSIMMDDGLALRGSGVVEILRKWALIVIHHGHDKTSSSYFEPDTSVTLSLYLFWISLLIKQNGSAASIHLSKQRTETRRFVISLPYASSSGAVFSHVSNVYLQELSNYVDKLYSNGMASYSKGFEFAFSQFELVSAVLRFFPEAWLQSSHCNEDALWCSLQILCPLCSLISHSLMQNHIHICMIRDWREVKCQNVFHPGQSSILWSFDGGDWGATGREILWIDSQALLALQNESLNT